MGLFKSKSLVAATAELHHAHRTVETFRRAAETASFKANMMRVEADLLTAERDDVAAQRDHLIGRLSQILAVLSEVAVYEDMDVNDGTVRYISELVRDHEELEARIDAALLELAAKKRRTPTESRVAGLLRGAERVPDTPEGL